VKEQQIQAKKIKELEAQGYYVIKLIKNNIMEIWKNIENYEGYQISNFGNVKSLSKKIKCKNGFRTTKEKILKLKKSKQGYLSIQLKNKGNFFSVHRLVALAFIDNPENKPQVNHINGIKHDNRIDNLEWCNQSENQIHAYVNKLQIPSLHNRPNGENQGLSKLKNEDVMFILENYKKGMGIKFSKLFNVSQTTILNIVNKKIWTHVRI
jgi:hypothetical protein